MTLRLRSRFNRAGAAAALLGAGSFAASAAELPIKTPYYKSAPAPFYSNWSGFYAGVNAGYGWGSSSIDVTGDATVVNAYNNGGTPKSLASTPKSVMGGVQAGYNWQWNKLVYGLEGDFGFAALKGSGSATGYFGVFNVAGEQRLDLFGTARGRIGYAFSDALLFYGTGGLALGHAKLSYSFIDSSIMGSPLTGGGSTSKWLFGWTLGAGVEYAFRRNWSVKGEYLYYDLGRAELSFPSGSLQETVSGSFKGNIVRVGLNYKF